MNTTPPDDLVDVSNLPPRERHPLIFSRWENLPAGSALLLRNDHDPLPLYYPHDLSQNTTAPPRP